MTTRELIESVKNERGSCFQNCRECEYGTHNCEVIEKLKSLAALEDKIEQGTLKEIPCNVGDTLYTNMRWQGDYMRRKDAPYPIKVVFIGINNSEEMGGGFINVVNDKGRMWQFSFNDIVKIGDTVFLTREEAEKRLEELHNG